MFAHFYHCVQFSKSLVLCVCLCTTVPLFAAKANSIATQLMQNPEMLSAIQTKLAGMVDSENVTAHMRR